MRFNGPPVPKNDRTAAAARVRQDPLAQAVLVWSRFPCYSIEDGPDGRRAQLYDMRFGRLINVVSVAVSPDS
jgi:hypothetical protein